MRASWLARWRSISARAGPSLRTSAHLLQTAGRSPKFDRHWASLEVDALFSLACGRSPAYEPPPPRISASQEVFYGERLGYHHRQGPVRGPATSPKEETAPLCAVREGSGGRGADRAEKADQRGDGAESQSRLQRQPDRSRHLHRRRR